MNDENVPVKYDTKEAIIADMFAKYKGMIIVDAASRKSVKEGLSATVRFRVEVEKLRLENGRKYLAAKKKSDNDAKEIIARVSPLETALRKTRDKDDAARAKVKADKALLDKERIDGIRDQIDVFRSYAENIIVLSSDELRAKIREILTSHVNESIFQEFTAEAEGVRLNALNILKIALKTKMQVEKEDAERKVENDRLKKIRIKQEAEQKRLDDDKAKYEKEVQAERDRIVAEQKKIDDERIKLASDKKAEKDRKEKEAFEITAKEEAKIEAEKNAIEKAEKEKTDRIKKKKADIAEANRQEILKPDKQKFLDFAATIENIDVPTINNPEIHKLLLKVIDEIADIANKIRYNVKNL